MTLLSAPPAIEFFAKGEPKPQPRVRAFAMRVGGGKVSARMYTPDSAESWKGCIGLAAGDHRPATPIKGPVRLTCDLFLARPASHFGSGRNASVLKPGARRFPKGDFDNYAKAIADCLTALGFWDDDDQVVSAAVTKRYVPTEHQAGARIRIEEVGEW